MSGSPKPQVRDISKDARDLAVAADSVALLSAALEKALDTVDELKDRISNLERRA